MIVKKTRNGKIIADHEQLSLEDILGKKEIFEATVDWEEDTSEVFQKLAISSFEVALNEFGTGDIIRVTVEKIGRKLDEDR